MIFACLFFGSPLQALQKGIALGLYSKDPHYTYQQELEEIKTIGATHVSLVVSWYQKNATANILRPLYPGKGAYGDFDTTPDAKLVEVIQAAHKLGLKVFLFPIVRLEERKDKEWRGNIKPQSIKTWLSSYRKFTLHYARLAARTHVDLFSVGSELCSMEERTLFWKKLISQVRDHYRGQLIYSANWDHYKKIGFWGMLDFIGLNGYYEVAQNTTPTIEEIVHRWAPVEKEVATAFHTKKIIFTEIGYPSIDGGCQKPWDYTRPDPVDLEEQAVCYEAFFRAWTQSEIFSGVYFWNWYGQGGPNDRTYTPRGKPAEKIVEQWYRNLLK